MKSSFILIICLLAFSACEKSSPFKISDDDVIYFKRVRLWEGTLTNWDQYDSPDILLTMGGESDTIDDFDIKNNISDLPITWNFSSSNEVQASNYKWFLKFEEIDSIFAEDGTLIRVEKETMLEMTFNPFLKVKQTDRNPVYIYKDQWEIAIEFYKK